MFGNQVLLVTGGTGSFGTATIRRFLKSDIREIRVLSRDEKKQDEQRLRFADSRLRYYVGDVRDYPSVARAMRGVDYVFHAAALKQVPSCEFFPMEAVKTNVIGTENVLEAAISMGVRHLICLSTDKAVYPINAMGMTKALMEKVVISNARNLQNSETTVCITRYGNVMSSRGSVIPRFLRQIEYGNPITVTNPQMTRFMMTIEEAIDLVLFAFEHGQTGDIFVKKAQAATIKDLVDAILVVADRADYPIEVIGTRHGEKLFESLVSQEEMSTAIDMNGFFRISPDRRDLNYESYTNNGVKAVETLREYNSHNCKRLNAAELVDLLLSLESTLEFVKTGRVAVID